MNTQLPTREVYEDRTATLRALLESNDADTDQVIREMARVLVKMNTDLHRIPFFTNDVALLAREFHNFVDEYLHSRRTREEDELEESRRKYEEVQKKKDADRDEIEFYKKKFENARAKVERTSEQIEAVKISPNTVQLPAIIKKEPTLLESLFGKDLWRDLVRFLVIGLLIFLGNAVWTYIKIQAKLP